MIDTQQDQRRWNYTVNTDELNPNNHTLPPYDITVFGALPKIDFVSVWRNCETAKAEVDDLAMLASMTVEN